MLRALSLAVVLSIFWLLLSGHYTPLLISLGVVSVVWVVLIARRMDVVDREGHPIHITLRFLRYWIWLGKEIFVANIDVVRLIWHPKMPITPTLIRLKTVQTTALGKVIYANSITLTPGTITTDVTQDEVEVHALTQEAADALRDGEMDRRVLKLRS